MHLPIETSGDMSDLSMPPSNCGTPARGSLRLRRRERGSVGRAGLILSAAACAAVGTALIALAAVSCSDRSGESGAGREDAVVNLPFVPPLCDAEVGEEIVLRRGNTSWRWRIVSVDAALVAVEVQEYVDDAPRGPLQALRWNRNGFGLPDEFVVRSIARDRIEVAGQFWDCWRIAVAAGPALRWYWVTDALPVHGVLRIAVDIEGKGAPDLQNPADYLPVGPSVVK
jgi:hypothetical protein